MRIAQIGYSNLELEASTSVHARLKAVLAALYRQDVTTATAHWQHLGHIAAPKGETGSTFRAVASYMAVLADEGLNSIDNRWLNQLSSTQILLVGPCNGRATAKTGQWVAQIVRIAGTTDFYNFAPADRTILYANGETDAWLSAQNANELEARFAKAGWFVTKKQGSTLTFENLRKPDPSLSFLHLTGHPNMVPLMCMDLLANPGATVHVIGANFYASQEMALTSTSGSTSEFHHCGTLASHNPFENRALVANLVGAGRVDGDASFADALGLGDLEYARVLDQYYGIRRR